MTIPIAMMAWLTLGAAQGQTITNTRTTNTYTSLQSAIDDATGGDTLEIDGTVTGGVSVDKSLTWVASASGGLVRGSADPLA